MHGKRGREDAGNDQNFSAVEEWRAAAELKCQRGRKKQGRNGKSRQRPFEMLNVRQSIRSPTSRLHQDRIL